MRVLSCVRLFATPWTSSMGVSRQEYWSGLPLPSLGLSLEPPQHSWSIPTVVYVCWSIPTVVCACACECACACACVCQLPLNGSTPETLEC